MTTTVTLPHELAARLSNVGVADEEISAAIVSTLTEVLERAESEARREREAIVEGLVASDAGRVRSANEADAELRARYGLPVTPRTGSEIERDAEVALASLSSEKREALGF